MDFHIQLDGESDLSGQIYQQLRDAVTTGRLQPDTQVPPSRELARYIGVSRTTVVTAYDRLVGEGLFIPVQGAGTFVTSNPLIPTDLRGSLPTTYLVEPQPIWAGIELPTVFDRVPEFDLRCGIPDFGQFPHDRWRRLIADEYRAGKSAAQPYGHPAGHGRLREAIAHHLAATRSVHASGADVIVTTGLQQSLFLVAHAVLRAGSVVAMEDPGYPPARMLLATSGYTVKGVPVDGEGVIVDELPDEAALVYVTPSHQFPLGVTMSAQRRAALLSWARQHGAVIVEDDYDSEFRYGGRPLEPLQSLDSVGSVVYAGSFSKSMLPSLRLGYLVVPAALRHAVQAAKFVADWYTPPATQAALAHFMERGWYARHLRKMRMTYEARHKVVTETLAREFRDDLHLMPSSAGLHVSAVSPRRSVDDCVEAVAAASELGVEIFSLRLFADRQPARPGFVIGYGAIEASDLPRALRRLRRALTTPSGKA